MGTFQCKSFKTVYIVTPMNKLIITKNHKTNVLIEHWVLFILFILKHKTVWLKKKRLRSLTTIIRAGKRWQASTAPRCSRQLLFCFARKCRMPMPDGRVPVASRGCIYVGANPCGTRQRDKHISVYTLATLSPFNFTTFSSNKINKNSREYTWLLFYFIFFCSYYVEKKFFWIKLYESKKRLRLKISRFGKNA